MVYRKAVIGKVTRHAQFAHLQLKWRTNLFAARIFKNPVESIIYDVAEFSRQ